MSSRAYSYSDDQVVFVHNVGDVTADEFRQVDAEIIQLMQSAGDNGSDKVNVLVDCTDLTKLPSLLELEGGRILKYFQQPNCGWTMIVGYRSNPFLVVLSRLLTSVMGSELYVVNTLDEARRRIQALHPSRPHRFARHRTMENTDHYNTTRILANIPSSPH